MSLTQTLKLGSHVSTRGGYLSAAKKTVQMGATVFQYFPKNPRGLAIKEFDKMDAMACKQFSMEHGLTSIAHTSYPTNLSESDKEKRILMISSLKNDLEIAEACGTLGVVVHFGKHRGRDPLEGYKLMIDAMNEVLADWDGQSLLLIENNAGQGNKMGITFEELTQVRKLVDQPEKIGFCFDTCHAFASGLWSDHWDEVVSKGKALGYWDELKAIHLNDSMYPANSFRDRHASIGKGYVGIDHWKQFIHSEAVQSLPLILETPNEPGYSHQDEFNYIRQLLLK